MRGGTPLARVLGLGSAKQGAHHWWLERVTAVALVPLGVWLAFALLRAPGWDHASLITHFSHGVNPTLLLLTFLTMTWHSRLGVQVFFEDYVHAPALKTTVLLGVAFIHALVAVAGSVAILKIAFSQVT